MKKISAKHEGSVVKMFVCLSRLREHWLRTVKYKNDEFWLQNLQRKESDHEVAKILAKRKKYAKEFLKKKPMVKLYRRYFKEYSRPIALLESFESNLHEVNGDIPLIDRH